MGYFIDLKLVGNLGEVVYYYGLLVLEVNPMALHPSKSKVAHVVPVPGSLIDLLKIRRA